MQRRILGLACLIAGLGYFVTALRLPMHTLTGPGPGFFPIGVALVLLVAAVTVVIRGEAASPRDVLPVGAKRRVAMTLVALVGFCFFLPRAGYLGTSLVFMTVMLQQVGTSWQAALSIAVASAAGSYYLFVSVLSVPLPWGAWLD